MLDAGISFLWPDGHTDTMLMEEDALLLPPLSGTYQPVETSDGWASIAAITEEQWTNLLIAVGREELLVDPRFVTLESRLEHLEEFRNELAAANSDLTTDELVESLRAADVPCAPLLRPSEVPDFVQVVANETLIESEHPTMGRIREPRPPARFGGTPSEIQRPAPRLGEHTDAILTKIGRSKNEIAKLKADNVVE